MSDLTPERLREAADTMAQLVRERIYSEIDNPETWGLDAQMIRRWAKNIEEEQAEEALRDKRIQELADEMLSIQHDANYSGGVALRGGAQWRIATGLLDRYPALLERAADE